MGLQDDVDQLKKAVSSQASQIKKLSARIKALEGPAIEQEIVEEKPQARTQISNAQENPTNFFRVFGVVGMILIVLGMVYFYKYAVDMGWIPIMGRVVIGIMVAILLIVLGFALNSRGYVRFSNILIGCGLAVLYFTIFATYRFEQYRTELGMTLILNTLLLLAVMGAGMIIGIKLDGKPIVYSSLFLGYLAAFLAGFSYASRLDNSMQMITFVILMNIIVLAIAKQKSWYIGIPAQILTYIAYQMWYSANKGNMTNPLLGFTFLFIFYALFTLLSFIQSSDKKEKECLAISVINAFAVTIFGLSMISRFYPEQDALYLVMLAALTIFVGYQAKNRGLNDILDLHFLMTIVLIGIAIPLQFDNSVVTILWTAVALGVTYSGIKIDHRRLFFIGYIGYAVPYFRALFYDLWALQDVERWLAVGSVIGGMIAIQLLIKKYTDKDSLSKVTLYNIFSVCWILLATLWIRIEIADLKLAIDAFNTSLSIAWALFSVFLIAYGVMHKRKVFNWCGIILFGIVVIKVVFIDLRSLESIMRVLALIIVGALSLVASFLFVKNRDKIKEYM